MALRLSKCLGRTPESWLAIQHQYDLWVARREVNLYVTAVCDCAISSGTAAMWPTIRASH